MKKIVLILTAAIIVALAVMVKLFINPDPHTLIMPEPHIFFVPSVKPEPGIMPEPHVDNPPDPIITPEPHVPAKPIILQPNINPTPDLGIDSNLKGKE